MLLRLLQQAPSAEVINATSTIADEECLVILGRIARPRPDLADAALEALDSVGSPGTMKIAAASRRLLGRSRDVPRMTARSKLMVPNSTVRSERTTPCGVRFASEASEALLIRRRSPLMKTRPNRVLAETEAPCKPAPAHNPCRA